MKFISPIRYFFIFISFSVFSQSDLLIPFQKDSLWGYKNGDGKIIISPVFEDATIFLHECAIIKKGKREGIIDRTGEELLACNYESIQLLNYGHAITSIIDSLGRTKKGAFSKMNGILLPAIYDEIIFSTPFVFFRKGNFWGLVGLNRDGVVEPIFNSINSIHGLPIAAAKKESRIMFFDAKGLRMESSAGELFDIIKLPIENNAIGKVLAKDRSIKYLLMKMSQDQTFKEIGIFDEIEFSHDNFSNEGLYKVKINGLVGIIDTNGKEVLSPIYEEIYDHYNKEIFKVRLINRTIILVNKIGENILPKGTTIYNKKYFSLYTGLQVIEYNSNKQTVIEIDSNGMISEIWKVKRGKVTGVYSGSIDAITVQYLMRQKMYRSNGERLIRKGYQRFRWLDDNLFLAYRGSRFHIYYKGEKIVNQWFNVLNSNKEDITDLLNVNSNLISFQQNGLWGMIDLNGSIIVPFLCEHEPSLMKDLIIINQKSKEGILDRDGNLIVPIKFDDIIVLTNDLYSVLKNDDWFLLKKGDTSLTEKFEWIHMRNNTFIQGKQNGRNGIFSIEGNRISPTIYESISTTAIDDLLLVSNENFYGLYSLLEQKVILPLKYNSIKEKIVGVFVVNKDNKYGVWSQKEGLIIPVDYSKIIFHKNLIERYDLNGIKSYSKLNGETYDY